MKKIFTLFAATAIAVAVNAESTTATFGSANNGEKDNPVTCPGFTIDGTYVAGGNAKVNVYAEDKGMKMRANKTDNTLILSVDENTTITALVMGVVTNDAEQTLPIIDVLVDGESVALEYPIVTYNTSNADGSAVINLTDIKATETIGLKFDDAEYTAKNKQVFIAGEVTYEEVAEAEPTFPETIDYTINGEKELAGVDVVIKDNGYSPTMSITGESDTEEITLTFAVPEGWDGWIINADYADVSERPIAKTRSEEDWAQASLEFHLENMGYKKGNSVTFAVEEYDNWATLALYKGDKVYNTTIDIEYNVVPAGGGVASDEPLIPESIGVTTYAQGLMVEQERDPDDGSIYIDVTGTIVEDEYDLVLDVPEGWDGYVILPFSENITIGDAENNVPGPRKISATDHDWNSVEDALEEGYIKGNKLTFKATGNWEFAYAFLYKGEQFDYNAYIGITTKVSNLLVENQAAYDEVIAQLDELQAKYDAAANEIKETNPDFDFSEWEEIGNMIEQYKGWAAQALAAANEEGTEFQFAFDGEEIDAYITMMIMAGKPDVAFPETFEATLSNSEGVEVNQYIEQEVYTISVHGMSVQKELTLTLAVPEGWDGFICMSEDNSMIDPLSTRAQETEWWPIDNMLDFGASESNSVTFPVDGEQHFAQFMLVKDGFADVANHINVEFEVAYDFMAANQFAYDEVVASIEGVQKEYEAALKEAEEANPDYDFSEWKEIIVSALNQTLEGAKQALESANEDAEDFQFAFDAEEFEAMIAEMKKAPIVSENQVAFDKVMADINEVKAEYDDAVEFIKEYNPEFDLADWTEIGKMIEETAEGAEKALYSANEDGVEYNFAFSAEDYEGMIVEMKKAAVAEPNKAAYDNVVAEINEVKEVYDESVEFIKEYNPEFDFSEWDQIIGTSIEDAATGAEQALNSANEDGNEFNYPFSAEDYEGMVVEMRKAAFTELNEAAYNETIASLDAVQEKYESAVAEIKEKNPDFDLSEWEAIIPAQIEEFKEYASTALDIANEGGYPFSYIFYGGTEEVEMYISAMLMDADPAPEFPTTFDVTLSDNTGVELTTDDSQGVFIVNVAGKSSEEELTITVAVPEGFDGFMYIRDIDMMEWGGAEPLSTRADEPEWYPISWVVEEGMKEGNKMTFPTDGELHAGQFFLCKHGLVDLNNMINVEFEVEYDATVGVNSVNAADKAIYFDLDGNRINNPKAGMYIKVVDGKATKVVVK